MNDTNTSLLGEISKDLKYFESVINKNIPCNIKNNDNNSNLP